MSHVECRTADDVRALARRIKPRPPVPVVLRTAVEKKPHAAPPPVVSVRRRRDWMMDIAEEHRPIMRILEEVSYAFDVNIGLLLSHLRFAWISRPRMVAIYLAMRHTKFGCPTVGKYIGGRDHSTVLSAVKRIEELRQEDDQLDAAIRLIAKRLGVHE